MSRMQVTGSEAETEWRIPELAVKVQADSKNSRELYTGLDEPEIVLSGHDQNGSGLKEMRCLVTDSQGYQKHESWMLEGKETITYVPDLAIFADGKIHFSFWVYDWEGKASEEQVVVLEKDGTCPVITGRMETKGQRKEQYVTDTCFLYLTVTDENFDYSCKPEVITDHPSGYLFSGWRRNGNMAESVITFSDEGSYQVNFSCRDLAGNHSETLIVPEFIIDRTAPVIKVDFDDTEPLHDQYYCRARKARITVIEQSFRPEDGKVTMVSGGKEKVMTLSKWKETDHGYEAELLFDQDGVNALSLAWTDPAGNQAQTYHSGAFIIDTVSPEVMIDGIVQAASYNGKVEPTIAIYDQNIDEGKINIELEELTTHKVVIPDLKMEKISDNRRTFEIASFGDEMDGIYQLSVNATDLAGNISESVRLFMVNRHGSYYTFNTATEALLQKQYIKSPEEMVIYEKNIDWLRDSSVILSCNDQLRELEKDKDYWVQAVGDQMTAKEYTYTFPAKCFEDEGTYWIYLDSRDQANNHSSLEENERKIGFVLDQTAPKISVINLEEHQYYHEDAHNFQVTVDDNMAMSNVKCYIDGELEAVFSEEEIEQFEGLLELQTKSSDEYQTIQIVAEDKAGNRADSGEWHVLVNTSERTRKRSQNVKHDDASDAQNDNLSTEDRIADGHWLSVVAAGIVCLLIVVCGGLYRYIRKKRVSIRQLPDTDDRK